MKKYTFNDRILECRFLDDSDTNPKRCPKHQPRESESTHRQQRKAKRIPELISRCHFFHGEKACPYTDKREQEYWFYESFWVNEMSDSYASADGLRHVISQYPKIKTFCVERGLPLSLIGMLISREEHWVGYIDSEDRYIDGLKKYYLKEL